jgi:arylsulfatase A-like enzyme
MKSPNILFIITDQQRADTLACYGNAYVQAPNLNRLASESVVFRHAYCTDPVCTPSRASIFTGLWPHTHGCVANNIGLPPDTKTVAEWMADTHRCAYYGKWHLGDELSAQHGFGDWLSIEDGIYRRFYTKSEDRERQSDYHRFLLANGFIPDEAASDGAKVFSREFSAAMAEPFTKAAFLGNEASRYLQDYQDEKPFFLTVSYLEPHPPNFSAFNTLHDPAEVPVSPAFRVLPGPDAPAFLLKKAREFAKHGNRGYPARTELDWRRSCANYYGLVTLVDRSIGRILDALEASGRSEDTLVVFASDHGEMLGEHGLGRKDVVYEGALRIPLMFRLPGAARRHRMVEGRVSLIDLVPTLADFGGIEVPAVMQGQSRRGVIEGRESLDGNDVFVDWDSREELVHRPSRTIITAEGWKMNLCPDDRGLLFDLNADPHELNNLFGDARQRDRIRELMTRLQRWQEATGDRVMLPEAG